MTGAPEPVEPTGEAFFLAQLAVIERVISFVCARHGLHGAEADDFSSHVKLRFIENDYEILRRFQGRSKLSTYLATVVHHLFQDYRNSLWGKWRPSAEATRAGAVAILLEQLIHRDGHTVEEACELLRTNRRIELSRAELEALVARLPARPRRRFESEDTLDQVHDSRPGPDELAVERERRSDAARASAALEKALAGLGPQDRLVLRLQFEDGRTVADIARRLQLDQKALYRRIDRLLKGLRHELESQGTTSPW